MAGHLPQRSGSLHPNIAPYGETFSTADNQTIVLAVGNDKQFKSLCESLGLPELANDPQFARNPDRVKNRDNLAKRLAPVIRQMGHQHLSEVFADRGIPAGTLKNLESVFGSPETEQMVLKEELDDGTVSKRVRSVVFRLESI